MNHVPGPLEQSTIKGCKTAPGGETVLANDIEIGSDLWKVPNSPTFIADSLINDFNHDKGKQV